MASFQFPPLENHKQFEALLCDLLNEHYESISFKCFGKTGHKQKGIDVLSIEKSTVVQCKHKDLSRSSIKIKSEILNDIDETLTLFETKPQSIAIKTLIIATTAAEHPDYDEFCAVLIKEKKLNFSILFWGWDTIQKKLSNSPKTVAIHYPNYQFKPVLTEETQAYRINMKKRIQEDFGDWLNYSTENRKKRSRMIIHSIDDTHYPSTKMKMVLGFGSPPKLED